MGEGWGEIRPLKRASTGTKLSPRTSSAKIEMMSANRTNESLSKWNVSSSR